MLALWHRAKIASTSSIFLSDTLRAKFEKWPRVAKSSGKTLNFRFPPRVVARRGAVRTFGRSRAERTGCQMPVYGQ
jgi:hypothetical protein